MLSKFENLVKKYSKRLASGSHASLSILETKWPDIAESFGFDPTLIFPSECRDHVVTIISRSSEEAAQVYLIKMRLISRINQEMSPYKINDISFNIKPHERAQ